MSKFVADGARSAVTREGAGDHDHPPHVAEDRLALPWRPRRLLSPGMRGLPRDDLRQPTRGTVLPPGLPAAGVSAATPLCSAERIKEWRRLFPSRVSQVSRRRRTRHEKTPTRRPAWWRERCIHTAIRSQYGHARGRILRQSRSMTRDQAATNCPRATFLNRASPPLAAISLIIAE